MNQPKKVGLVFAALLGGWHVVWALLVLIGAAQPVIDFIFWAHMIRPLYIINGFALLPAVVLVVITSGLGYVLGYLGTILWNKLHQT